MLSLIHMLEILSKDLKRSYDDLVDSGKVIVNIQTIVGDGGSHSFPTYRAISSAAGNSAIPVSAIASGKLPPLWEERQTPKGRTYFVDHNTRTTTWADPRRSAPGTSKRLSKFSSFEDERGRLTTGWEWRETSFGRTYYVDHNTNSTSWTRPGATLTPNERVDVLAKTASGTSSSALSKQAGSL